MTLLPSWLRTKGRAALAMAVAVALVGAVLAGRCSRPPPARIEEKRDTVAKVEKVEAAKVAETRATVRQVKRTETRPGGIQIVTVEDERTDVARHEETAVATVATVHTGETRIVEAARPDWRASLAALWRPADLALSPAIIHGELSRRVLGPVLVGVAVQYDRPRAELAAGVVVTVEW
jgi:hypothetical protein